MLSDYRDDAARCGKCSICKIILPIEIKSAQYSAICPSGTHYHFDAYYASGKMEIVRAIYDGELNYTKKLLHILYSCTGCGACNVQCFYVKGLRPLEIFEEFKFKIVEDGFGPLPEHKKFEESIDENNNPYQESHNKRLQWLKDRSILDKKADVAFFVGCTAAYRLNETAKAVIKILEKKNINFTVLSNEWCCGSPLLRTGQKKLAKKLMEHNVKEIEDLGIDKVIFSCAGCYRAFKEDYPKFNIKYSFKPLHVVEYIADLIDTLKFKNLNEIVTYHDPCHLGRHLGIYEAPRKILNSINGVNLVEMERNKEYSWCCGAGSGVKAAIPDFASWSARERINEALSTGAKTLISCCPFCEHNLKEASISGRFNLEVMDLMEYLEKAIEE